MSIRPKTAKWIWLLAAAVALGGGAMFRRPLDALREEHELAPPGNYLNERHPEIALVNVLPGGLRAWAVNFFWIRSQELHQEQRYYDARQRAEWICALTPYHAGVWSFLAWEMAWNISVNAHTPEERWNWVRHGMELLRDRAIPRNPQALILYKDLAWIFFFKMGLYTDEMHMTYKQRWAAEMQDLLGAPPYGTTQEAIDAFRPVAEIVSVHKLLDKDPRRQGRDVIQADMRKKLLAGQAVGAYAALLAARGVGVDETLLVAYNRFSRDANAAVVRWFPPRLDTERDKAVSALINAAAHAEARGKMLAFLRAQILWNRYRMDPEWMFGLMKRYNVPLDWRQVLPNGLYWVTYGLHVVKDVDRADIDVLNTERIVLNCLKTLTWTGRMTYVENLRDPESPQINWLADWRFIDATQQEFLRAIGDVMRDRKEPFKDNILKEGHINYLVSAMAMLYAGYRRERARELYDWTRENYQPTGEDWKMNMEDFIIRRLNREGRPIREIAESQISAALIAAFHELGSKRHDDYRKCLDYAMRVYRIYQKPAPDRLKLPPFEIVVRNVLINLMVRPEIFYARLPLTARIEIYAAVGTRMQVLLYDLIAPAMRAECDRQGLDFDRAFPVPTGLEEYRQRLRQRLAPADARADERF